MLQQPIPILIQWLHFPPQNCNGLRQMISPKSFPPNIRLSRRALLTSIFWKSITFDLIAAMKHLVPFLPNGSRNDGDGISGGFTKHSPRYSSNKRIVSSSTLYLGFLLFATKDIHTKTNFMRAELLLTSDAPYRLMPQSANGNGVFLKKS